MSFLYLTIMNNFDNIKRIKGGINMTKIQITDIDKQILIEKSNFISKNSTFFHHNLKNADIIYSLRNILLSHSPLTQCFDYQDLIAEIKKSKIKNIEDLSYSYSFEVLFTIINSIRYNLNYGETSKLNQIEFLRLYVKYISNQTSGKMYYSMQKIVNLDEDKMKEIMEVDHQFTNKRRNH